jgi:DNA-directed RNA polymerase specialized sigma24 family protein
MSVLARRASEEDHARRRALLALRDSVIAVVSNDMRDTGSLAVAEAVDAALAQLLKSSAEKRELEHAKRWWVAWAKLRLIDKLRLAASLHRDALPVDEHPEALALHAREDPLQLATEGLDAVALQEILSILSGPQREWGAVNEAVTRGK